MPDEDLEYDLQWMLSKMCILLKLQKDQICKAIQLREDKPSWVHPKD